MTEFSNHRSSARITMVAATALALLATQQALPAAPALPMPAAVQSGPPPRRVATRNAITEQELRKKVEAAPTMDAQMKSRALPVKARPSMETSFLTNSLILSDGGMYTVVPVGSILNLPPAHRRKVLQQPEGEFTFWPDFLQRNSNWLAAREVPLKMAKGDAKAGEAIMRAVSMESKVVVSVYKGGPITILEASPEAAAAQKAASTEKAADTNETEKRNP